MSDVRAWAVVCDEGMVPPVIYQTHRVAERSIHRRAEVEYTSCCSVVALAPALTAAEVAAVKRATEMAARAVRALSDPPELRECEKPVQVHSKSSLTPDAVEWETCDDCAGCAVDDSCRLLEHALAAPALATALAKLGTPADVPDRMDDV